jgi:hypothetical protein
MSVSGKYHGKFPDFITGKLPVIFLSNNLLLCHGSRGIFV